MKRRRESRKHFLTVLAEQIGSARQAYIQEQAMAARALANLRALEFTKQFYRETKQAQTAAARLAETPVALKGD